MTIMTIMRAAQAVFRCSGPLARRGRGKGPCLLISTPRCIAGCADACSVGDCLFSFAVRNASLARPLRSGTSMFTMQFMIVYKHPCGASSISLRCSQAHLQGAAAGHFARSRSCNPQRSLHHHQYIQLSSAYHLNIISISSYHHHSNDQSYNAVPHSRTWKLAPRGVSGTNRQRLCHLASTC